MAIDLATELAELLAVDTSTLTLREYTEHMARFERARARLEAHRLGELESFEASGAFEIDGAPTSAVWVAGQTGTSAWDARRSVNLARRRNQMRYAFCALADGAITEAHVRVLERCVKNPRTAGQYAWDEPYLVGKARKETADQLAQRIRRWIAHNDPDGTPPNDPQSDVFHLNRVGDRVKGDFDLCLETGLPLIEALNERTDQLFHRDKKVAEANPLDGLGSRTPGNRRAEAAVELMLAGAGAESNPRHRDPLFTVLTNPKTFATARDEGDRRGRPEAMAEMMDGTVVPLAVFEVWRCGGYEQRAYLDGDGVMLALGREERYANRELRRALAARDRGCGVPGCDRPPEHCDAHHVIWWENFGPTDIDNMVLLCRYHHNRVHAGRLSIEMVDGKPRFYDATGSLIREGRHRTGLRAA